MSDQILGTGGPGGGATGGIVWLPGGPVPYLAPTVAPAGYVAPRSPRGLNSAARSNAAQQATVAGANSAIPIIYGRRRIGAKIAAAIVDGGDLVVLAVWCLGEVDAIESVTINDTTPVPLWANSWAISGFYRSDYLGTATQGVDPTLAAAFGSAGKPYADTLRGATWSACYSVVRIPVSAGVSGFPRLTATIRGRKVAIAAGSYVTMNGTTQYASTPDSTQTRVDEDFTIDARVTLNDWTPAANVAILAKYDFSVNKRTYSFVVDPSGFLKLYVSTNGIAETIYTSSAATGVADGATKWLRVIFRKDNGASASDARFYLSDDGLTWTQLGTTQTAAVIASLYQSDSNTRIGNNFSSSYLSGKVYYVSLQTTTKRAVEFQVFGQAPGASSWVAKTGETWTLQGGATVSSTALAWSRTPADVIADFVRDANYGLGRSVEYRHLLALYAANTELVGGEQRHLIDLAIDTPQETRQWVNVLRDYAHCFCVPEGDDYILVRDYNDAAVASFDSTNIVAGSLKLSKRGAAQKATVVEVTYTETGGTTWRDETVTVPESLASNVPRRLTRIAKPGITRYSEARRYAIEVLNESTLNDLSISFDAFDDAGKIRVGNIVTVTHPIGFAAKAFRVTRVEVSGAGRYAIQADEFDPLLYSSEVAIAPGVGETVLPSPANPPAVTSLAAIEERYQTRNNLWSSRIRVTWTLPTTFPSLFVRAYRVEAFENSLSGSRAFISDVTTTEFITPALKELVPYVIRVSVVSTSGAVGPGATANITPNGKQFAPTDVTNFSGFEAGGIVFLSWSPSTDVSEDVLRYEVRRGTTGSTWTTATRVDRVDALTLAVEGLQAGTYRFFVKAIDSVGNESANAATVDVTVTVDQAAFLVTEFPSAAPVPLAMTQYDDRSATYYATDWADGFEYGATTTDNATGTFNDSIKTEDVASPHSGAIQFNGTSSYIDVPDVAALRLATALTVELWVFPTELSTGQVNVLLRKDTETLTRYYYGLTIGADGKARAQYYNGTLYEATFGTAVANRTWSHIAMTISGTALTVYVNGVASSSTTIGGIQGAPTGRLGIGYAPPSTGGGAGNYSKCLIKRARVWNVARTAAEIAKSSSYGGVPPGLTGCVGNWRMDDKADADVLTTTVTDTTGTSNGTGSAITWRAASELVTESFDVGGTVTGVFSGTAEVTALTGAAIWYVETSTDNANWTRVYAQSARAVARYFRLGIMSASGGALVVKAGTFKGSASIAPKTEMGYIDCLATGTQTVTLANGYSSVLSIQLTPQTTTDVRAVFDNIELSKDRGFRKGRAVKVGNAIGTDYISVGSHAVHQFGNGTVDNPFSVEAWIRPNSIGATQVIVSKGSGGATGEWNVRLGGNGQVRFLLVDVSAGAIKAVDTQFSVPAGSWTHIACTYDGTEGTSVAGMKIYFNGIPQAVTSTSVGTYVAMEVTAEPLIIGNQYYVASYNAPFNGYVDEIRIWSTERTPAEILANLNDYVANNATGLNGYWKMDETSGTTASDSTSNNKPGTLNGACSFRPYDGFDVYAFTGSAVRTAARVFYQFQGA